MMRLVLHSVAFQLLCAIELTAVIRGGARAPRRRERRAKPKVGGSALCAHSSSPSRARLPNARSLSLTRTPIAMTHLGISGERSAGERRQKQASAVVFFLLRSILDSQVENQIQRAGGRASRRKIMTAGKSSWLSRVATHRESRAREKKRLARRAAERPSESSRSLIGAPRRGRSILLAPGELPRAH